AEDRRDVFAEELVVRVVERVGRPVAEELARRGGAEDAPERLEGRAPETRVLRVVAEVLHELQCREAAEPAADRASLRELHDDGAVKRRLVCGAGELQVAASDVSVAPRADPVVLRRSGPAAVRRELVPEREVERDVRRGDVELPRQERPESARPLVETERCA